MEQKIIAINKQTGKKIKVDENYEVNELNVFSYEFQKKFDLIVIYPDSNGRYFTVPQ